MSAQDIARVHAISQRVLLIFLDERARADLEVQMWRMALCPVRARVPENGAFLHMTRRYRNFRQMGVERV